jgi:DNA-damage-inducible protein J
MGHLHCNTFAVHHLHWWSGNAMPKTAYINARVDRSLKAKAEKVLSRVGISTTDAITMLLHQIVLRRGLPFEARIPNKETIAAMQELDRGGGERFEGAAEELSAKVTGSRKQRRT